MPPTTHLKSLQALEMAIRAGSLTAAADRLGLTPAAVGQRIRALEDYLGADLLRRGRSGLAPTDELAPALADLDAAFAALDRVTRTLDFQRACEIHIVADTDWADLWLTPRLPAFRKAHPKVWFCINGTGDVPLRLGAPDLRVVYGGMQGEALFTDALMPISGPDNVRRVAGPGLSSQMEGMPLLHLKSQLEETDRPGWVEWFRKYGLRASGTDRGVRYSQARLALEAVRQEVGYLLLGLAMIRRDLQAGLVVNLFPPAQSLPAPHPYRLALRGDVDKRPQVREFVTWLRDEARETRHYIEGMTAAPERD